MLRTRIWTVLGLLCSCSCATVAKPYKPTPQELFCNDDDDCVIATAPLNSCGGGEPYAVSRDAAESKMNYVDCPLMRIEGCDCHTKAEDWTAVCSEHVCERSRLHFFSWPRAHCRGC